MNVPNMGDSISEGTIVELCFKSGDYVNVDDIVEVGAKLVTINPDGQAPAGGAAKPAAAPTP